MSLVELLRIDPLETLHFPFVLGKQITCSIRLTNKSAKHVAFKFKTSSPKIGVQPNIGVVLPHSKCHVVVKMQAQFKAPPDMVCKDIFQLESVVVTPGLSAEYFTQRMFSKEWGNEVGVYRWRIAYGSPAVPIVGDLHAGDLQTEPIKLQFPFKLNKEISCSMQLTNKSDNHVAFKFKVKTTTPKKYSVRPNYGVVLPHSACDILVTMQAQNKAPPGMICLDKFVIQSFIVNTGVTPKDITAEMFNKESENQVDEAKLGVAYVQPTTPFTSSGRVGVRLIFKG